MKGSRRQRSTAKFTTTACARLERWDEGEERMSGSWVFCCSLAGGCKIKSETVDANTIS